MSSLKISPSALADIQRLFVHMAQYELSKAQHFNQILMAGLRYLNENPESGELVGAQLGIRKSVVDSGTIELHIYHQTSKKQKGHCIVRIFHAKENPNSMSTP